MRRIPYIIFVTILLAFYSCDEEDSLKEGPNEQEPIEVTEALEKLQQVQLFFGHQSVGMNILSGIETVAEDNQVDLTIIETSSANGLPEPCLAHAYIGQNFQPLTKLDAFASKMNNGLGEAVDIAFMKFCYVDIDADTDVEALFAAYQNTMNTLQSNYPNVTFVHFTAPLKSQNSGAKAFVKKALGKTTAESDNNIKREQYNALVREAYQGNEPFFDLAKVESTYPDGSRSSHTENGFTYYSMVNAYTDDGGHLNETGREVMAGALIQALSQWIN